MGNKQMGRKLTQTFDGIIAFIKIKYIYQHMTQRVRFCQGLSLRKRESG